MFMKRNQYFFILLLFTFLFDSSVAAQTKKSLLNKGRATKVEIKDSPHSLVGGKIFITVGGKEIKIDDSAIKAWIIKNGKDVVYSDSDGAGGFENEGQSLRIYNVATGKTRKILSESSVVDALLETKISNGETALLVKMSDGGLNASEFAVVDPQRGEVFYRGNAELTEIKGDQIKLAFYRNEDWDAINADRNWKQIDPNKVIFQTKVTPTKIEIYDLKAVLKNKGINNKPTDELD
jgi:hypothetical protein